MAYVVYPNFPGYSPRARLEIPGAHHKQESCINMKVGAEALSRPWTIRRRSSACTSHIHRSARTGNPLTPTSLSGGPCISAAGPDLHRWCWMTRGRL